MRFAIGSSTGAERRSQRPRLTVAVRLALKAFRTHNASRFGAALAFYMVFSIVPALLIAIAVAGMLLGRAEAQREILDRISVSVGSAAGNAIETMVREAPRRTGWLTTILGLMSLYFGLTGVYRQIDDALRTIWRPASPSPTRLSSMLLVAAVGGVMLLSVLFDGAIAFMGRYAADRLIGGEMLWQAFQLILSTVVLTVLFGAAFRYLPQARVRWSDVRVGAAVTAILFVSGKFALGIYLRTAAVGSAFGAAGSIVVVLLWSYWSAQIFFFGLEFTHVYAQERVG